MSSHGVRNLVLDPRTERKQTESQIGKYLPRKKKLQYLVVRELGSMDTSPEQESTNSEPDNNFSAWSSKRVKRESRPSPE